MFIEVHYKRTLLPFFLLCALLGSLIFSGISACGNSLNRNNYLACRASLETDRQKIRAGNGYSYKSESFEECLAPANFQKATD